MTAAVCDELNEKMGMPRACGLAALGYAALVGALLHRLFVGEVLSPAANLKTSVPFSGLVVENVTPHLNNIHGDVWRYFEPAHAYQYRSSEAGRFPLWNPHIFCGFPFHANGQSAMFSPFHWIYFVVDPKWAVGLVSGLKLWVAGFAAFCFARWLGMSSTAAFVAGMAWMLCAFNVRWLLWNASSAGAVFPLLLWSLDAFVLRQTWRRAAVAALAGVALHFTGHPETQFHMVLLGGVYVVVRLNRSGCSVKSMLCIVAMCLGTQLVALLGAAASLLPFVEQMMESSEWHEGTRSLDLRLPWHAVIGLVAPDAFGRPRADENYAGPSNYVEAGLFFGIVPTVLALSVLLECAWHPRRLFSAPAGQSILAFMIWIIIAGLIVFAVPGVSFLISHVPVLAKANNLRLVFAIQFGGVMLAAVAWTRLVGRPDRSAAIRLIASAAVVLAAASGVLVLHNPIENTSHLVALHDLWTSKTADRWWNDRSFRTLASCLAAAGMLLFGFGFYRAVRGQRGSDGIVAPLSDRARRRLSSALIALASADLLWVAYDFNPIVPAEMVFPPAPVGLARVIESAGSQRIIATDEILPPNVAVHYGFRDVRGYDFPLDRRWAAVFRELGFKPEITLLPRSRVFPCVQDPVQSFCDKTGVRFLYTNWEPGRGAAVQRLPTCSKGASPAWSLVQLGVGSAVDAVYQNPAAYPRVYFARRVETVAPDFAMAALLDVNHDLRELSFVEEEIPRLAPAVEPGDVHIDRDAPEELVVTTRAESASLLVVSDRYDSNWCVEIDGEQARVLRTNYLFRGVIVPAGEHVVRWYYWPLEFYVGCAMSLVVVVGLVVIACSRWGTKAACCTATIDS